MDGILLASNTIELLKDIKTFLSSNFDMNNLGETFDVLGIFHRDGAHGLLGLSQQNYNLKVLKWFGMESCSFGEASMSKGDKLLKNKNSKNGGINSIMDSKPYGRLAGSLIYAQVCTRPDLASAIGILSRFQSNPTHEH